MAYDNLCAAGGYSCQTIGYFSNPDLGHPITGFPLGDEYADNRQTINAAALFVSAFRTPGQTSNTAGDSIPSD